MVKKSSDDEIEIDNKTIVYLSVIAIVGYLALTNTIMAGSIVILLILAAILLILLYILKSPVLSLLMLRRLK